MRYVLFTSLLILTAAGVARADSDDRPGRDWMPLARVASKLHDMGFDTITKIEADDGLWEAKGYRGRRLYKIKLDPVTGRVVEQHREHEEHADRHEDHDDD